MSEFIIKNSAIIVGIVVFGIMGMFASDHPCSTKALVVLASITLVFTGGYWTSREGPSDVAAIAEVNGILDAYGAKGLLRLLHHLPYLQSLGGRYGVRPGR